MSDLTTLRAEIRTSLHMNSPYVDAAIANAIDFCSNEELYFNGAKFEFKTEANVFSYPLPKNFLRLRGRPFCTPSGESDQNRYALMPFTTDEAEESKTLLSRYTELGWLESYGNPRAYALDVVEQSMLLAPLITTGGDTIFFRYTMDLGTPTYTMTYGASPTVTLLGPSGETLPASFSNSWFVQGEGYKLIKERALYELLTTYHGGTDQSQVNAQAALMRFLEELKQAREKTSDLQSVVDIRPYL